LRGADWRLGVENPILSRRPEIAITSQDLEEFSD
jgi:hypothetical protein